MCTDVYIYLPDQKTMHDINSTVMFYGTLSTMIIARLIITRSTIPA